MTITPGQHAFIVGKSGSGKSSVANILLRLYPVSKGIVTIDGFPINSISSHWLFDNITLVEQHSVLFDLSIADNIRMGNHTDPEDVSIREINQACRMAKLDDFIDSLPAGIDTNVGVSGSNLSGGQRQRVCLARARIRDNQILILDESLNALDITIRDQVIANVRRWRQGKTTIFITHDFSIIGENDYLYRLGDDGQILESGIRKDLDQNVEGKFNANRYEPEYQSSSSVVASGRQNNPRWTRNMLYRKKERASILSDTDIIFPETAKPFTSSFPYSISRHTSMQFEPRRYAYDDREDRKSFHTNEQLLRSRTVQNQISYMSSGNQSQIELAHMKPDKNIIDTCDSEISFNENNLPEIQSNDSKKHVFKSFRELYKHFPNKILLNLGLFMSVLNGSISPLFSFSFAHLFEGIVPGSNNDSNSVLKWSMVVLALAFADGITTYLKIMLLELAADQWIQKLRSEAMSKILAQDLSFFNENEDQDVIISKKPGDITSLIMNDIEDIRTIVTRFFSMIATVLSLSLLALIWSMIIGWKLSLVGISLAPLLYLRARGFKRVFDKWESLYRNSISKVESFINETLSEIRTVKFLSLEATFLRHFQIFDRAARKIGLKRSVYCAFGLGSSEIFPFAIEGLLLYYGMRLIATQEYTMQDTFMVLTLMIFAVMTVQQLLSTIPQLSNGFETVQKILMLINLNPDNCYEQQGKHLKPDLTNSCIEFSNVDFTYEKKIQGREYQERNSHDHNRHVFDTQIHSHQERYQDHSHNCQSQNQHQNGNPNRRPIQYISAGAIDDEANSAQRIKNIAKNSLTMTLSPLVIDSFNLRIKSKEVVCIAGQSGSGKSTICALISKLYDATRGTIAIGGTPITDVDTVYLRNQIAVVPQMPMAFFEGSILANLEYGLGQKPKPETISNAARTAQINEFIAAHLPHGYETQLGGSTSATGSGSGALLSGGQLQRLGLARALIRDPKILILDECTSSLDPQSAAAVRYQLQVIKNSRTMTIIMISHQPELMQLADRVIFMNNGRIEETGHFNEIMASRGSFYRLMTGRGDEKNVM